MIFSDQWEPMSSMDLRSGVEARLRQLFPQLRRVSGNPLIYQIGRARINLRTASQKAGDKYWFDATPRIYERRLVHFLAYACGSADNVYIFPVDDFATLITGASLSGQKQVPNFTIYLNRDEFEPAGHADRRHAVAKYRIASN